MALPAASTARPLAIVTGGSSGIGLALARRLRERGWRLVLVARGADRLAAAVEGLGGEDGGVRGAVCDIGDDDAVVALVDDLRARAERPDLLVCNAGVPARRSALTVDVATARAVIEVNYLGLVRVTRALWPDLVAAGGRVVNVVSVAGTVAVPGSAPYSASKHAALAWSRSLAALGPASGVHVLTVNPGPVATAGFPQTKLVGRRLARHLVITDDRCADAILHALDHGRRETFIPQWWRAVAMASRLPTAVARWPKRSLEPSCWRSRTPRTPRQSSGPPWSIGRCSSSSRGASMASTIRRSRRPDPTSTAPTDAPTYLRQPVSKQTKPRRVGA